MTDKKRPWAFFRCDRCGCQVLLVRCRSRREVYSYFCQGCKLRVFDYKTTGVRLRRVVYK
jgi:hypothetical protein